VEDVLQRGKQLVVAAEVDCQDIEERLGHLQSSWDTLREAAVGRLQRLQDAHEAQQYYLDAGEAQAWISEQELYVFSDESPKVCWGGGCQPGYRAGGQCLWGTWGKVKVCRESTKSPCSSIVPTEHTHLFKNTLHNLQCASCSQGHLPM
jgi:hypothetical protein